MSRYRGPACKLCRREGLKLFLKGDRCYTEKCAIERRPYAPGQHGQTHMKFSEYGTQLREKQKVKRMYGLVEQPFRLTFHRAENQKGVTGDNLIQFLERRLDNVVYRLGFANSRTEARLLIRHGHFNVNDRSVNVPSYGVKAGDVVTLREKSKKMDRILKSMESVDRRGIPDWLELNKDELKGSIKILPERSTVTMPINEQLIVELYSK